MLIDYQVDRQVNYTLIAFSADNPSIALSKRRSLIRSTRYAPPLGEEMRPKEVPWEATPRHRADDAVEFRAVHHLNGWLVGEGFPTGEEADEGAAYKASLR